MAQSNLVSADAAAAASSDTTQTVALPGSDSSAATPEIGSGLAPVIGAAIGPGIVQQITSSQFVQAISQASQTDPSNLSIVTSGVLTGLSQTNTTSADSTAMADFGADQTVSVGADGVPLNSASSVQSLASSQSATASAETAQTGAFNLNQVSSVVSSAATIGTIEQTNTGISTALAATVGTVVQVVSQFQGGTGLQSETASQTAAAGQSSTASAMTSQAHVGNVNVVVIPVFGISNPPLSQINIIGSHAEASSSSRIVQTVNQAVTNSSDTVSFDVQASQDARVTQSGAASSAQTQANRTNIAGWGGLSALPQASSAPTGSAKTVQAQTVMQSSSSSAQTGPVAQPPAITGAMPPALPSLAPTPGGAALRGEAHPALRGEAHPSGPFATPETQTTGTTEFGPRTQTGASESAASTAPSGSHRPTPVCEQQCGIDLLIGAIGSARGTGSGSGDPVAALSRLDRFAPPGAGWVQLGEPAPGRPAFTSPIERPG